MDRLHIHQIFDLLFSFMCHTGALGDQLFVVFDANLSSIAHDHQIVVVSALVRKLDIKAKIFFYGLFEINLAHIVSSGGHIFMFNRIVIRILNLKTDLRLRCFTNGPAV